MRQVGDCLPAGIDELLRSCGIDVSEARTLLAWAGSLSRVALIAHPEYVLPADQQRAFSDAAARRRAGEPIAYLIGEREFYGLVLRVTPDVLIPRPETEALVDFALQRLPVGGTLLDLGTGSGAIALAVKSQRPDARVTAAERSEGALEVARENASRHGLDIEFLQGDWYQPVVGRRFDLVLSNPPYVAAGDPHLARGDLRFEPATALIGGSDGLDALRHIVALAASHLLRDGWLCVEHGKGQDASVRELFEFHGFGTVASGEDLAGIARITFGKYNLD